MPVPSMDPIIAATLNSGLKFCATSFASTRSGQPQPPDQMLVNSQWTHLDVHVGNSSDHRFPRPASRHCFNPFPLTRQHETLSWRVGPGMHGDTVHPSPNFYPVLRRLDLHLLASVAPRNAVSAALPHDEPIPANLAAFPQKDGAALGAGQRLQEAPLNGKPVCGSLMRAAVASSVGYMDAPQPGLAVEVLQVRRPGRGAEVFLHVPEESLHLALGLSPVRSTQADVKSNPQRKVQKALVPFGLALLIPPRDDQLGVVIEHMLGDSAQLLKGVEMGPDEVGQVGLGQKLHIPGP